MSGISDIAGEKVLARRNPTLLFLFLGLFLLRNPHRTC
jgi:hypothetical protein